MVELDELDELDELEMYFYSFNLYPKMTRYLIMRMNVLITDNFLGLFWFFFEESYWGNKRFLSPNFWWAFDLSIKDCHFYLEIEVNFVYISKGSLDLIPSAIKELWTFGFVVFIFFLPNLAGRFQQTFCTKKLVDNAQKCFAFTSQAIFPAHNLNFYWRRRWSDRIQAIF